MLKFSHIKAVTEASNLNNEEGIRELNVYKSSRLLPFCPTLLIFVNRWLPFRHHVVALSKKLYFRVTLLRQFARSGWGAGAKTLHHLWSILQLGDCPLVWCRNVYTSFIDSVLYNDLRIFVRHLRPTSIDQ